MADVDAVVIGAGHNGLVAANLLADAGWDVVVCEAESDPGGAVRSAEILAPGFVTDLCSAFYPMAAASPVLTGLDLLAHGLRWRHSPVPLAHVFADRAAVLSRELDRTATSLDAFAPGDGEAWRRVYADWQRMRDDVLGALFAPFPPVRGGLRLLRRIGTADALRLARFALLSVRRYGVEEFAGEGAKALLAGLTLHTDLTLDDPSGALYGWILAMIGQEIGFPVPEGGASGLIDALVRRLTKAGGELRCGERVTDVVVAGGRALGVRTAGGEAIRARRAVIADVSAPALYQHLVAADHLPERLLADIERFAWDNATLKIDYALAGPVPWTAEEARGAGTVHVGGDLSGLATYAGSLTAGRLPRTPFMLVGQMTTSDPSRSPAGTESMWAYTHLPRDLTWDRPRVIRHADRVQETLERYAPGFGDLIRARRVTGPVEFQTENANLDQGALNGGTSQAYQQLIFRPVPGLGRADTPIDRLYLASASAHPGGGVHGGGGSNAARAALARNSRAGGLYATAITAANRAIYR